MTKIHYAKNKVSRGSIQKFVKSMKKQVQFSYTQSIRQSVRTVLQQTYQQMVGLSFRNTGTWDKNPWAKRNADPKPYQENYYVMLGDKNNSVTFNLMNAAAQDLSIITTRYFSCKYYNISRNRNSHPNYMYQKLVQSTGWKTFGRGKSGELRMLKTPQAPWRTIQLSKKYIKRMLKGVK